MVRILDSIDIVLDSDSVSLAGGRHLWNEPHVRVLGMNGRDTRDRDLHATRDSVRDTESSALSQASEPRVQPCVQEGTTAGRIFIRIAGCTGLRKMQLTPHRVAYVKGPRRCD